MNETENTTCQYLRDTTKEVLKGKLMINGEKLKSVPLKPGTRQVFPLSLFNIVLEVLPRAMQPDTKMRNQNRKIKKSLFTNYMILHTRDLKSLSKNLQTR